VIVIAYLVWQQTHIHGPVLVIGPLSTVGNWCAELARFAPGLSVVKYRGSKEYRAELRETRIPRRAYSHADVDMPIFVCSYETAMSDHAHLSRVRWRVLVVDEVRRVRVAGGGASAHLRHRVGAAVCVCVCVCVARARYAACTCVVCLHNVVPLHRRWLASHALRPWISLTRRRRTMRWVSIRGQP
jgi:hypothetical protein